MVNGRVEEVYRGGWECLGGSGCFYVGRERVRDGVSYVGFFIDGAFGT